VEAGFAALGGAIIDVVGISGQRVTAQISAGRLFRGWAPPSSWLRVGETTFDGDAAIAALGHSIVKANIRITMSDGDSGSPNPVYVAMFGAGAFPYLRSTPQPTNYDFDGGNNLYFGFEDLVGDPVSCGFMGASTTFRLDASHVTYDTFTGWPGIFALTDPYYAAVPKPGHYMNPVQAGQPAGVWPVTGWFQVPGAALAALHAVMATGVIRFGVWDISISDQYYDFRLGIATDVIDIPFTTIPPAPPPDQFSTLDLWVWRQLEEVGDLEESLNFPPGYQKALLYALMVEMFDQYPAAGKRYVFDELQAEAADALKDLETLHASDAVAMEPPI
jgi:hypothetical protein